MTDLAPLRSDAAIAALFPAPAAVAAPPVRTFEDVERHLKAHGPKYLLQALRTLQSHCRMAPLSTLDADLGWFLGEFPRSSRQNPMPRPDLRQGLDAYKKWHTDIRRALEFASGARVAKAEREARADGWTDLLAAIKAQTEDGGLIHPGSAGTVKRLADLGRRQGFEPWDLANPDVVETIEDGLAHNTEREPVRSALRLLADHRFLPEIAALLPPADQPLVVLPTRRDLSRLPDHVDAVVRQLVAAASLSIDPTNGRARPRVAQKTIDGYLAAMRYHLRTLRRCAPEPAFGYAPPTDLAAVNDVVGLFGVDHISATLRWTERHDHLPETLEARSAYQYYKDIERILKHARALPEGLPAVLVGSHYMQDARALCDGMTPEMQEWCEALVTDPAKERAFHAMHRTLMRTAEDLLARARREGRAPEHLRGALEPDDAGLTDLAPRELTRIRALGVAAAASAIELAGRPIRKGNVLGLRWRGGRRNFFAPTTARPSYGFHLAADEMKAGKAEPRCDIQAALYGARVLDWYLAVIRPLFPHAKRNIHLFPAVEHPTASLDHRTFDTWFQKATAETPLPMTFHRWRHGYATILLAEDWNNLQLAADMLGNTVGVCAKHYGWIDKQKTYSMAQNAMARRSKKL